MGVDNSKSFGFVRGNGGVVTGIMIEGSRYSTDSNDPVSEWSGQVRHEGSYGSGADTA